MDDVQLRLILLLVPIAIVIAVLVSVYFRAKRKARTLRSDLSQQRRDALRSINLMIQQMVYDAEVLQLMRHARASNERRNETDFNAALDRLVRRENDLLARVDRAAEFEDYLQRTYKEKKPFGMGGESAGKRRAKSPVKVLSRPEGDGELEAGAEPEQLKEDIRTFLSDLERIRAGELNLLDEKIAFFEKWVESPERREMLEGLRATAFFLEKGDASGLEKLKARKKMGNAGDDGQ